MRVLVPLPFDTSNLVHGRNLRVVNLLQQIERDLELTVLVPDAQRAAAVQAHLRCSKVQVMEPGDEREARAADQAMGARTRRSLAFYDQTPQLALAVARLAPDFEAILGFDVPTLPSLVAARSSAPSSAVICDLIDDPWLTWQSLPRRDRLAPGGLKSAMMLRHLRRNMLPRLHAIVTAGPRDAEKLNLAGCRNVHVVPNGVEPAPVTATQSPRDNLAAFTGFMGFPPNEAAALYLLRRIWPSVCEQLDEGGATGAQLAIVGADPSRHLRRAARHVGAFVTGRVPSVRDWLLRARVAVAPMVSGSGIKNKILEACACGCALVTTPFGAAGLPTGPENGILVADTALSLAGLVAVLLRSPEQANAIGQAGLAMVKSRFTWSAAAEQLLEVIHEAAATPKRNHTSLIARYGSPTRKEACTDAPS